MDRAGPTHQEVNAVRDQPSARDHSEDVRASLRIDQFWRGNPVREHRQQDPNADGNRHLGARERPEETSCCRGALFAAFAVPQGDIGNAIFRPAVHGTTLRADTKEARRKSTQGNLSRGLPAAVEMTVREKGIIVEMTGAQPAFVLDSPRPKVGSAVFGLTALEEGRS